MLVYIIGVVTGVFTWPWVTMVVTWAGAPLLFCTGSVVTEVLAAFAIGLLVMNGSGALHTSGLHDCKTSGAELEF